MEDVYAALAGRVGFAQSRYVQKVFRKLLTPEEARMLLALPKSPEDLAAEFGMTADEVGAKLDEFDRKGVAIPLVKDGVRQYFCARTIIQIHDATIHAVLAGRYEGADYEIVRMWEQFRETEWFELLREHEKAGRHMRVLPLPGTVEGDLLPEEDLERILRDAEQVAVVPCPCRVNRVREGDCDKPVDVCLSLTPGAVRYVEESRTGRVLTKDEAFSLLNEIGEAGLIPTTGGAEKIPQLCFCCTDCCIELRAVHKYGYHLAEKSRFEAAADPQTCTGCQSCVERCPFDAIEMRRYPSSKKWLAHVDGEKCYGCGACAVKCPSGALSLKAVRPPDFILNPHAYLSERL